MKLIIISGLSGSGKSIALTALEDMEYYCIDNLPAILLPQFAFSLTDNPDYSINRVAVSIDSRNRQFLQSLPSVLKQLDDLGIEFRIIFLGAENHSLIKRFSETRRKHPLTNERVALLEGIEMERNLLAPLFDNASKKFDTSHTTPHELRTLIRDFAGGEVESRLSLLFQSFGYKHGNPLDADFVFDVRCLPNPYWQEELRAHTGLDKPVQTFLEKQESVQHMIENITTFLDTWLPHFKAENRSYISVAIGCTGGQHRSVYISEELSRHFRGLQLLVHTRHRDIQD